MCKKLPKLQREENNFLGLQSQPRPRSSVPWLRSEEIFVRNGQYVGADVSRRFALSRKLGSVGVLKPCCLAIAHRSLVQRAPCESAVLQFRPREVNCKITAADCVTFIGVPHDGRCFAPFRSVGSRFPQLIIGSEGDQTSQPRRTGVTDLHAAFTCDRGAVRSAAGGACLRSSSLAIGCGAPHSDRR